MRSLAVDGFSADEVARALTDSGRTVAFAYDLLDASGDYLGTVDTVERCTVENNALATNVKRTAKIRIRDTGEIDYLSDRIRPAFRLRMPGGTWVSWPLGVFVLSSPDRQVDGTGTTREVECYDLGVVLLEDAVTDRYVVTAGTAVTTAVRTLLDAAGIVDRFVTESTSTLPADRDWPPGTPRGRIVDDLLASINYRSLYFDAGGFAVAEPYTPPTERTEEHTYAADSRSVLEPEVAVGFDLFTVPNSWVATVSEPDRPVLRSTYTNTNPASPTSTVNRGRTIVDHREVEAADQASLDGLVARIAFEASQVLEIVEFTTWAMPHHEDADVLRLTYPDAGLAARYTEHTWTLPLEVGAAMQHRVRRVVAT